MSAQAARAGGADSFQFGEISLLANEYQLILISFQAINTLPELQNYSHRRVAPLIDSFWFNETTFKKKISLELIGTFKINVWGSYYCKSAVFIAYFSAGWHLLPMRFPKTLVSLPKQKFKPLSL